VSLLLPSVKGAQLLVLYHLQQAHVKNTSFGAGANILVSFCVLLSSASYGITEQKEGCSPRCTVR